MKNFTSIIWIPVLALAGAAALLAGCVSNDVAGSDVGDSATLTPVAGLGASGAELWAANCARCHNLRSPSEYSDANWEIAGLHMRIRANLTAEEHRAITDFLKSAN